ncbi:UNVERIFIED_ORG: hemoglobin/transferrin/lactoferrin receptor protein [Martelella mediterranea]
MLNINKRLLCGATALAVFAAGGLQTASAQSAASDQTVPGALQGALQTHQFNIPAQAMLAALADFTAATDIQVIRQGDEAITGRSDAVSGNLTADTALRTLLRSSGYAYRFTGNRTAVIFRPTGEEIPLDTLGESILLDTIDVNVVGGAPADIPYQTPGSGAYISSERIQRLRGNAPGDIFVGTPGVTAAGKNNGAKLDVNIRGMQGQGRVKVAIDGTQQSTTTWRGYQGVDERVYIDPDMIGGVDISKGPSGGAQGAGANGGVVEIRTIGVQDILEGDETFGVRLRGGISDNAVAPPTPPEYHQRTDAPSLFDFNNGSGSIAAAWAREDFDFIAAFSRRKTGNYFAGKNGDTTYEYNDRDYPLSFTKPGEEVFNTSEDTTSGLAKATFRWGNGQSLQLGYVHFQSEFGESMGSLLFQQDDGFRQVQLSDIKTNTYTARYRWTPDDNELIDLRANIWAADVSGTTRAVAAFPDLMDWGIMPADEPRYAETHTYGGDITNTSVFYTDAGTISVDYGGAYTYEDMDGDEYCSRPMTTTPCVWMQPSVGNRSVGSVFSTTEWEINDWLTLDGGLRYDMWRLEDRNTVDTPPEDRNRDGGSLSPSIGVTVSPFEGVQLFTRYAEGIRPPTMRETMFSDGNATPNPDLLPETTKSWEAGVNYLGHDLFTGGDVGRLKLAYFHNDHKDYISRVTAVPKPGEPMFTFANLNKVKSRGIELSGAYDAGGFFTEGSLNYYTEFEFCETSACSDAPVSQDYAVAHVPPEIALTLTAGVRLFDEKLTIGGRVNHSGKRLLELTQSDRQRTPMWVPYTTVDAFVDYEISDNLSLNVQAQNLFDRYYVDSIDGWVPAPGRTIRANLTARF